MKKTEIEILEDIKQLKIQLVEEIEDVIYRYYSHMKDTQQKGELDRLGRIDILAALELVKLRFYDKGKQDIHGLLLYQNQIGR